MTTNQNNATATETRPQFVFDGRGINGPDQYRTRLATLTEEGHNLNVGPLFAAAPELLQALEDLLLWASIPNNGSKDAVILRDRARTVLAKAKGQQ